MCGRCALVNGKEVFLTGSQMTKMRELGQPFKLLPRYNASPTQMMPVILHGKDYAQWLDPENNDTGELKKLLVPYPASRMKAYPVSKMVSNSRNDSPGCWIPVAIEQKKPAREEPEPA